MRIKVWSYHIFMSIKVWYIHIFMRIRRPGPLSEDTRLKIDAILSF